MPDKPQPGLGVDRAGNAVIDPTANVQALSEASNKRQDDLRAADIRRLEEKLVAFEHFVNDLMAAHDKRYEQRYEAQQKALDAAFINQKDAVMAAMVAQKEASNSALTAQERAVAKAETAAEKRFEGADKARAEQAEQQRMLMPRSEAENRLTVLAEKIGVLEGFRTEVLSRGTGAKEGYGYAVGVAGLLLTLLSLGVLVAQAFKP